MRKPEENKHREHFVPVGKQHVHECASGYRKQRRGSERVIFLLLFRMLLVLLGVAPLLLAQMTLNQSVEKLHFVWTEFYFFSIPNKCLGESWASAPNNEHHFPAISWAVCCVVVEHCDSRSIHKFALLRYIFLFRVNIITHPKILYELFFFLICWFSWVHNYHLAFWQACRIIVKLLFLLNLLDIEQVDRLWVLLYLCLFAFYGVWVCFFNERH